MRAETLPYREQGSIEGFAQSIERDGYGRPPAGRQRARRGFGQGEEGRRGHAGIATRSASRGT